MASGVEPFSLLQRSFPDYSHPPTPPDDYESMRDIDAKTPPMELNNHPPTPDRTPQGLKPPRPPLLQQNSSYAESFTTAEEELSRRTTPVAQSLDVHSQQESIKGDEAHHESVNGHEDQTDDWRWKEIPGAFRNTPSIASSRPEPRPKQYVDYLSTPSTKSSKRVRVKQYLTVPDSASSTGSSECLTRPKSYHEDPDESPLGEKGRVDQNGWEEHASDVHSKDEHAEFDDNDGTNGHAENEPPGNDTKVDDNDTHDWNKHVSYISFEDAPAEGGVEEVDEHMKEEPPASGRLSGQGRRMENGEELKSPSQQLREKQPTNNIAAKEHSASLRKTGHLAEHNATIPNVKLRSRRNLHAEVASLEESQLLEDQQREAAQTLASSRIPQAFLTAPPRDSTDEVYQQIQRANMERFAAMEDGNAVGAIVLPNGDAHKRGLRHITKQQSLRSVNAHAIADESPQGKPSRGHNPLRRDHRHVSLTGEPHDFSSDTPTQQKRRSASGPLASAPRYDIQLTPTLRHEKRPLSRTSRHEMQDQKPTSAKRAYARALATEQQRQEESPSVRSARGFKKEAEFLTMLKHEHKRDLEVIYQNHEITRRLREQGVDEWGRPTPRYSQTRKENIGPPPSSPPPDLPPGVSSSSFNHASISIPSNNLAKIRSLNDGKTPVSISGMSDKTDFQVCEAQNMAIYPHTNESVLLVGQNMRPNSQVREGARSRLGIFDAETDASKHAAPSGMTAPSIALNGEAMVEDDDGLLTNPHPPPIPPVIQFIPPTPAEEEEKQLMINEEKRRPSLTQRARRFSGIVVRPLVGRTLTSRHRSVSPSPRMADKQDKLHPNWVPNNFWDEEDDGSDYYPEDLAADDRLPPGGDTSDHPRRHHTFPRRMSVRMPGFRGRGGFHLGNSLGIDRHGTNTRRHHVDLPISRPQPEPVDVPHWKKVMKEPKHMASTESMRALALAGAQRRVKIPMTKVNLEYVRSNSYRMNLHIIKRARQHSDHLVTPEARQQARRNLNRRKSTETGYEEARVQLSDAEWVAELKASKKEQDQRIRARYNLQHDNSTEEVLWNIEG